ncbi:MAG: hypothetical protein K1X35_11690 [Caulobacteraceae bacterium]|nr:hypothetical protein [Caulobacteraceae bacterium]
MPRRFDGVLPERPAGSELPDRLGEILQRVLNLPEKPVDMGSLWALLQEQFPRLGQGPVKFDGGPVRDHAHFGVGLGPEGVPGVQNWHDLNPDAGTDKVAPASDAGGAWRHIEGEGEFHPHADHYNSQALSAHPDWFLP